MQIHGSGGGFEDLLCGGHGFIDLLRSMELPAIDPVGVGLAEEMETSPAEISEGSEQEGFGIGDCGGEDHASVSDSGDERGGYLSPGDGTPEDETVTASDSSEENAMSPSRIEPDVFYPEDPPAACSENDPATKQWEKRPRLGAIPDFRTPTNARKSALEATLRKFGVRSTDFVVAPEPGMEFDSLPEAYDFYNLYSWEIGFGIRYGQSRKNASSSRTKMDIVCACAGRPRHEKSKSMSCGCKAMIRLRRTADNGWFIQEFRKEHNHSMSVTCGEKMQWFSHRSIDPHTMALVRNLRDNNVGLTILILCVPRSGHLS